MKNIPGIRDTHYWHFHFAFGPIHDDPQSYPSGIRPKTTPGCHIYVRPQVIVVAALNVLMECCN